MRMSLTPINHRYLLLTAELLLVLAVLLSATSHYGLSVVCLGGSTILYYSGMRELVRKRFGTWAVRRFTIAYFLRALSWFLIGISAFYTYSAVIRNVFPFGPSEFFATSIVALVGAVVNYLSVGIRNSVLWKIEGLRTSLWFSRLNSIVLFMAAIVPFLPALAKIWELTGFLKILAAPALSSFTFLALLSKVFYLKFLLTSENLKTEK
ncbi:hypothetical protein [Thermococcus gammatolerans]|nr:hypothetical protein [Thermococcus gammatolerans]